MHLKKVISGFQTGADMGGLAAALISGIPTGGWATKSFKTEKGEFPELGKSFGLVPATTDKYPERTELNVRDSDMTIWFGNLGSPGFKCTNKFIQKHKKLSYFIEIPHLNSPMHFATLLNDYKISVLNVAGNRESKNPGIYDATKEFLVATFNHLIHEEFLHAES